MAANCSVSLARVLTFAWGTFLNRLTGRLRKLLTLKQYYHHFSDSAMEYGPKVLCCIYYVWKYILNKQQQQQRYDNNNNNNNNNNNKKQNPLNSLFTYKLYSCHKCDKYPDQFVIWRHPATYNKNENKCIDYSQKKKTSWRFLYPIIQIIRKKKQEWICISYYSLLTKLWIPSFTAAILSEMATMTTGKPEKVQQCSTKHNTFI